MTNMLPHKLYRKHGL